jgi:hypothetical protein
MDIIKDRLNNRRNVISKLASGNESRTTVLNKPILFTNFDLSFSDLEALNGVEFHWIKLGERFNTWCEMLRKTTLGKPLLIL